MPAPGGKIGHAEVQLGDSRVMLTDEYREMDWHIATHIEDLSGAQLKKRGEKAMKR